MLTGKIAGHGVQALAAALDKLLERGERNIILDMTAMLFINSTGLGMLLKYADVFESAGGHMAFCRVPSKVMLVMEMLGFNALFNICPDEGMALRSFAGKLAPPPAVSSRTPPAPPPGPPPVSPAGTARCRAFLSKRVTGAGALELTGNITPECHGIVRDGFRLLYEKGVYKVIVRLQAVCNEGLADLQWAGDEARAHGGDVVIVRGSPEVMAAMEAFGLRAHVRICDDMEAAYKVFESAERK
jgi:anti-anti-sigma factor